MAVPETGMGGGGGPEGGDAAAAEMAADVKTGMTGRGGVMGGWSAEGPGLGPGAGAGAGTRGRVDEVARLRARAALVRKRRKTPLEDALASDGGSKAVRLVQWARTQRSAYDSKLSLWRENRRRWAQEAQDIFDHRAEGRRRGAGDGGAGSGRGIYDYDAGFGAGGSGAAGGGGGHGVFEARNDSINIVAALAEFASAQCEEDIFGGEPWFSVRPEGREDPRLAEEIQKHLQWVFRDGRFVDGQCAGIDHATVLGEAFSKTFYSVVTDEHEEMVPCLHIDGKAAVDADGEYVTTDAQVGALGDFAGRAEWRPAYAKRQRVIWQGVECVPVHFNDISFREDAPELDLLHTNVYVSVEMSVAEARERFSLSKEDALRLARCAGVGMGGAGAGAGSSDARARERQMDAVAVWPGEAASAEEVLGEDELERMLNTRVRLVEGYILADVLGAGRTSRVCIVFPPAHEDWIVWADYLANISPGAELPVHVAVWEPVPHKLYGRGFFAKYAYVQTGCDELWNQVQFRNAMHANPITAIRPGNLERDEDDGELVLRPGLAITPKGSNRLGDCIEFAQLPDLDDRSMELFQVGMQLAQLRSGISSASQGDLSALPENNTATGIRSLMSRAAVLLKKPVRRMRRSKGRAFSYAVRLFYANFDREEAFVWGEGRNAELVRMTPEKIANLDLDVRMLLTQEQNQTKLEGAQVASGLIGQWLQVPEAEKAAVRPLFLQAIKALEFDQADEIVRQPMVKIEDCIGLLSPEEGERLQALLEAEAGAGGGGGPGGMGVPGAPGAAEAMGAMGAAGAAGVEPGWA